MEDYCLLVPAFLLAAKYHHLLARFNLLGVRPLHPRLGPRIIAPTRLGLRSIVSLHCPVSD